MYVETVMDLGLVVLVRSFNYKSDIGIAGVSQRVCPQDYQLLWPTKVNEGWQGNVDVADENGFSKAFLVIGWTGLDAAQTHTKISSRCHFLVVGGTFVG